MSLSPSISADGQYIVFSSSASNLIVGDTNETGDIFVYDRKNKTIERVSIASNGTEGNGNSSNPAISANGRYVVFQSRASNFVENDNDEYADIFRHDRVTGNTVKITYIPNQKLNDDSTVPSISDNGNIIAYQSSTSKAVSDIFVQELNKEIEYYRFRNKNYSTGTYLFVGQAERDSILANPDFNQTFELEGNGQPAFKASLEPGDDLLGFYRLRSLDQAGTYLFAGPQEYQAIFADNSDQKNKWVKEGLDQNNNDIAEFYLYGVGANKGIAFNRFQNKQFNTFLFAGPQETQAILQDPNFSNAFINQGGAFESLI